MKKLKLGVLVMTSLLFVACGGGVKQDKIVGEWKLAGLTNNGEKVELTDCDKQTTWNFTEVSAESLADGTKVQILIGSAPDDCKFYSFDSKWTVKDGKLFVSTSRIGGMGGLSLAGMMNIVELTDKNLVIETMGKEITLEK